MFSVIAKTLRNARQLAFDNIKRLKMAVFIALQPDCPEPSPMSNPIRL